MIIGPRSTARFGRRWRRRSAAERAAGRLAVGKPEVGSWRRPPPAAAASHLGIARPAIASAAIAPPAPPAPVVHESAPEQAPRAAVEIAPELAHSGLIAQLAPAAEVLSANAGATAAGRRDRLVLVTSPAGGEGVSRATVALALALRASAARPVLLVDGDALTARTARALGAPPEPGLTDLLAGDAELVEVIRSTSLEALSFMPPGRPLAVMPQLLATPRGAAVMHALLTLQPSGLVVIDGPALLTGITAAALAAYAGQVILLVTAGTTSLQAIGDSQQRLGQRDHVYAILARPAPSVAGAAD